jgi:hypothetical protein
MNGFHDFDDFRVIAWMNDGLIIRLEQTAKVVNKALKKAAVVGALAVATVFTTTVPATAATLPAVESSSVQFSFEMPDVVDRDIARMAKQIDEHLASLMDFSFSAVDPTTLALATEAVSAVAARSEAISR